MEHTNHQNYNYHLHTEKNPTIGTVLLINTPSINVKSTQHNQKQQLIQSCLVKYHFSPILRASYSLNLLWNKFIKR